MDKLRLTVDPALAAAIVVGSAVATAALIWLMKPWLIRYAMARPNARSSHATPTPQGGGIAIVLAVATVVASSYWLGVAGFRTPWVFGLLVALAALAIAGAIDDIRPQPVLPRLALQIAVAALLMMTLPVEARLLHFLPPLLESALLTIGLVWFINLTNFMDGIDWMTVVEVLPISITLAFLGMFGIVPQMSALLPLLLALIGAVIGFAPSNAHVARLFMGDVGSLPIGALVGWLLIVLALSGHWEAALILPLYYLADATITLLRRAMAGENVAQAHRGHFYQRAVQGGFTVPHVTNRVFQLNVVLAVLAVASVLSSKIYHRYALVGLAAVAVFVVLREFSRGRQP